MKIAVSTSDGSTICGHLGKCKSFIIFETDGGEITGKSMLNIGGLCPGHSDGGHGHEHTHRVDPFAGCGAVITQGMGQGMLIALAGAGIRPVITELSDPDAAVRRFLDGGLDPAGSASCSCGSH